MEVPNRYAKCNRQFCNLWQSKEERREKYSLVRALGFSSYMANRLRDWRNTEILKYAEYAKHAKEIEARQKLSLKLHKRWSGTI